VSVGPVDSLGRIIVGLDGSASSMAALEWAVRQAELTGAKVLVITAWSCPSNFGWGIPLLGDYCPERDAETLLGIVLKPVRQAHPTVTLDSVAVEGPPTPALISASKGGQLLVVGSRGHGEFAGGLLGSVSEHCVTNAHCPVVVVRGTRRSVNPVSNQTAGVAAEIGPSR
jgi:nucleotide-binding universal stress UspA family protein